MNWNPGENFVIAFDDKTAEPRDNETLKLFVAEIRAVANKYDFGTKQYGSQEDMRASFNNLYYEIRKANEEERRRQKVKATREYIANQLAHGINVPEWMYPCCDNENRDMNGGCKSCGDPCF